jgi:hypothetical protein
MDLERKTLQDNGDIEALLHRLEKLLKFVDHSQAICNTMFDTIRRDCEVLIADIRIQGSKRDNVSVPISALSEISAQSLQDISVDNNKLQKTYFLLTKYPDGATADEIANIMRRHRTTVSTYLNQLVEKELAKKSRKGHEIYYRAVLNKERGTSE